MAFATVLFTITLGFLLLSMVKERGELRHKTAALVDPLTGLANRRAFLADAEHFIAHGSKPGERLAVMLADLDRFKSVNDQFGHAIGDRVLQIFAHTVTRALRTADMSGRLGGEEFAFLIPGVPGGKFSTVSIWPLPKWMYWSLNGNGWPKSIGSPRLTSR